MPATVVAVIPARGGSKGLPRKNLADIGGRSLVERAIDACRACPRIDVVAVSTDDPAIAQTARSAGAEVVDRPVHLAGDEASSESALLHALDELEARYGAASVLVFVQATSPFIDPDVLGAAVDEVRDGQRDVVFSAVETYEFLWRRDGGGTVDGVNHDASHRPRRQDREPDWRETGAFYVMDAAGFAAARHRFFGRIGVAAVSEDDAIEIDTPEQLAAARRLAADRAPGTTAPSESLAAAFAAVQLLVTDFDGVHTDDRAIVADDGTERVIVSRSDGHGIKHLRHAGVPVLILSTETNPVVTRRAEKLRVDCLQGIDDKWTALRRWLGERGVDPAAVAYVGNDVNDLECLAHVGLPIAVADAHPLVRQAAAHVTARRGGRGAVREVADLITSQHFSTTAADAVPRPEDAPRQGASL